MFLNTAKAQGVTGFLNKLEEIKLKDITIKSNNHYATIMVVSMDNKPIKQSEKILLQVGTIARSTDWKKQASTWKDKKGNLQQGFEIINYGKAPWRLENNDIQITLNNPKLTKAIILDANGLPKQTVELNKNRSQTYLQFPTNAKYVILE
ncbi:hypothetical protein [Crocosphaera watsonii]|uniref:hypothetical protein n=1 Tax=Crocosphaera watsonii TaxID=263511 RepID=UPI00065243EC|nr:hypothetical protein [Crocosphaera watsonii]